MAEGGTAVALESSPSVALRGPLPALHDKLERGVPLVDGEWRAPGRLCGLQ